MRLAEIATGLLLATFARTAQAFKSPNADQIKEGIAILETVLRQVNVSVHRLSPTDFSSLALLRETNAVAVSAIVTATRGVRSSHKLQVSQAIDLQEPAKGLGKVVDGVAAGLKQKKPVLDALGATGEEVVALKRQRAEVDALCRAIVGKCPLTFLKEAKEGVDKLMRTIDETINALRAEYKGPKLPPPAPKEEEVALPVRTGPPVIAPAIARTTPPLAAAASGGVPGDNFGL